MLFSIKVVYTTLSLSTWPRAGLRRGVLLVTVLTALCAFSPVDAQVGATNLVPNSSLEQISSTNPNLPISWAAGRWGDLDAHFTYRTSGRTGGRSVQVDITRYVSGDAKWYFSAQPVTPGQTYRIADYYQSTVPTALVLALTLTDGSTKYVRLKQLPPASVWTEAVALFTMPANTHRVSVFHLLQSVGRLITDDYAVTLTSLAVTPSTSAGFTRGMVSITLDDGSKGQFTNGAPLLERYGMRATFYISTGWLSRSAWYMTPADVVTLKQRGHEIAAHTVTHPDLTQLTAAQVTTELADAKLYLEQLLGVPVPNFASPFGRVNDPVMTQVRQRHQSHRGAVQGHNTKGTLDAFAIVIRSVHSTTTLDQVKAWVEQAQRDRSWLVLAYHVIGTSADKYHTTPEAFEAQLQVIKSSGIHVATVKQALNELLPQR